MEWFLLRSVNPCLLPVNPFIMEVSADYVKLVTIAVLHSPVKLSPASKLGIHFLLPAPFYILSLFLFAFFGGGGGGHLITF